MRRSLTLGLILAIGGTVAIAFGVVSPISPSFPVTKNAAPGSPLNSQSGAADAPSAQTEARDAPVNATANGAEVRVFNSTGNGKVNVGVTGDRFYSYESNLPLVCNEGQFKAVEVRVEWTPSVPTNARLQLVLSPRPNEGEVVAEGPSPLVVKIVSPPKGIYSFMVRAPSDGVTLNQEYDEIVTKWVEVAAGQLSYDETAICRRIGQAS